MGEKMSKQKAKLGVGPSTKRLQTPAIDNHGRQFQVVLEMSMRRNLPAWILRVEGGREWYMSTLMEAGEIPETMALDFGAGWGIVNFGDVMREALTLI